MSRGLSVAALGAVSAEQWGMVTAAQARELGVSRVDLNRLVEDGSLERVEGAARVYRLTGAPPEPDLEGLRAAWLQLGDGRAASARLRRPDVVASHRSAAAALGLGDLLADTHEFYVSRRRQLRRRDVRLRVRPELAGDQWRVVNGLPVCTAERLVADLLVEREDESAVGRICQDALRAGLLSWDRLVNLAAMAAGPYGAQTGEALAAALAGSERPAGAGEVDGGHPGQ